MVRSFFSRLTIIIPVLAVAAAGAWIGYTVFRSQLDTVQITPGLLTEIAAADRDQNDEHIDNLLRQAWSGVALTDDKTAINEPIMLALLEVQVELRRMLGTSFRSDVPVVRDDPACQIDLIEQQLLWIYAASIATTQGPRARGTIAALSRFARELACISGLQATTLDTALTSSFNTVALRLRDRSLDRLVPYLARFMAPFQLMLLDVRKHVGVESAAWRWFNRWNTTLVKQVAYGGWVTDRTYLWDRRYGAVIGFAPCVDGQNQSYCVDVKLLLNTIAEGKHLGLGGCSFAGMIGNRAKWTDTGQRYTCGVNFCSDRKRSKPKTAIEDQAMARLESIWPGMIDEDDRKQYRELCYSTAFDKMGASFDPRSCLDELYGSRARQPFEQHLACLAPEVRAARANAEYRLLTDDDLAGVTQNPNCGLLQKDTSQLIPAVTGCAAGAACLDFGATLLGVPESALQDTTGLLADAQLTTTLFNPSDQGTTVLCDNPAGCVTQCTALSQQITRRGACGVMLDPDKPEDRPVPIPDEQLGDPLYLVSFNLAAHEPWDQEPAAESAFSSCSLGFMNESRPAVRCGLLMCPDGSPAIGVSSACSCRSDFGGNFTEELMCKKLRCADGSTADENCLCFRPDIPGVSSRFQSGAEQVE
jgi:hypothetical protein